MSHPDPSPSEGASAGPATRLVLGLQPTREAIRVHQGALGRVLIDDRRLPRLDALARYAAAQGVKRIDRVRASELDRLARGASHQGVACYAPELRLTPLSAVLGRDPLLVLALDGVQDPQNFGAIVRSAVAIAQAPVLWPESSSAPLTPATFRASAGAIEHAELIRVPSLLSALHAAVEAGCDVVGLEAGAQQTLEELPLGSKRVLVMGSEHEGLGRAIRKACTHTAQLLRPHAIDSLNVSVAAGIALFQARPKP
ncbi:MAG: RNA methyltransferase [Polyangiaceae bacterium]|nr:RNA methyltransferase [Polyangiaceae bacterium]MCW5791087.1 RNA methyltransferase [Polyangiaceae bacterium]